MVKIKALPSRRPARPILCKNEEVVGGTEHKIVEDKSPISIPISKVGVQDNKLGDHGKAGSALNRSSVSSRVLRVSKPVCSRAITRCTLPDLNNSVKYEGGGFG